jgi:anti-anti-sigma factor
MSDLQGAAMLSQGRPTGLPEDRATVGLVQITTSSGVLALYGDLDPLRETYLRGQLATLAGKDAAVVDLSGVGYLDSMALTAFVRLTKDFVARDARLVWLVPPQTNARRIFAVAELDRYFTIVETLDTALQTLTAG